MSIFSPDFFGRCEAVRRYVGAGEIRNLLRWRGRTVQAAATLDGYGDYISGDDYLYVDWNHCARHDELLSRRCYGKEESVVRLLIDDSPRMRLGQIPKFDAARRLALGLAYLAEKSNARVGAGTLSASVQLEPASATRHLVRLAGVLDAVPVNRGLDDFARVARLAQRWRCSNVIVLSDLLHHRGMLPLVEHFRRCGHQVVVLQVHDRQDFDPIVSSRVELKDVDTGDRFGGEIDESDLVRYGICGQRFQRRWHHAAALGGFRLARVAAAGQWDQEILSMLRTLQRLDRTAAWRHRERWRAE